MSHVTHTNESSQLLRLWRSFLWLFPIFLNFSVLSEMRAHYIVGRNFGKSLIILFLQQRGLLVWDTFRNTVLFCGDDGLFCRDIGFFCRDVEFFCRDTGLYRGDIGLFCRHAGLFCKKKMGSFVGILGCFVETLGFFVGILGSFAKVWCVHLRVTNDCNPLFSKNLVVRFYCLFCFSVLGPCSSYDLQ